VRTDKRWTTIEYLWRFALRPFRWLITATLFMAAVGVTGWALEAGNGLAVISTLIIYGIWEIGQSIRSVKPMVFNVARGEKLIVQKGAQVSVPKADLDRVIEAIGRQSANTIHPEGKAE
jgi:hypothetical protein